MKVLTIREPWASLIINGYKKYEFRSWKTNYRGVVLIHAGKGIDRDMLYIADKYKINITIDQFAKATFVTKDAVDDGIAYACKHFNWI